ncbi:hypothetical protein Afil01_56590 [Actinorhabdospora filicis]|uniref:DUF4132 domain-containing protein n=1 Tax=Actinorhabdospora filicis TaxID=1785913 RepID=A0A9W6SS64_9ACTN|nr:DUF4132 domain-containing protein [Actinorhabdospora filicis]GLZ80852.1 hypothetical protein Afil01_56590 [Actinorhabdospora filicis]
MPANDSTSDFPDQTGVPVDGWTPAGDGYELRLDGTRLLCRNSNGRELKSVPKKIRESTVGQTLQAVRDWLVEHDKECLDTVESWLLAATPLPGRLIAELWPDPSWRMALENLVIADLTEPPTVGLLRGVDEEGRIGLIDLDAETVWFHPERVLIAHPVLLEELDEWRGLVADLGARQEIAQLARDVFLPPSDLTPEIATVIKYANARFDELQHATGLAQRHGFPVRAGWATCQVADTGSARQARYWLGADDPWSEAATGELVFVDADEEQVPLAQVGPIAWSEGIRMAELIYAGRSTDQEDA